MYPSSAPTLRSAANSAFRSTIPAIPTNSAPTEITDAGHLARAITFIATTPACADAAFNVTDGGLIRWERLWPRIAALFEMPAGRVRTFRLADMMADKEALWSAMVERHGLVPRRLADLALWQFADTLFRQTYDVVSSTHKIRQAGFHEIMDSEACFLSHLAAYRAARLLP